MRRSSQGKGSTAGLHNHEYDLYNASARTLSCHAKAKPRPSKWDDAQKWLSSGAQHDGGRRRSDDRLLLPSAPQKGDAHGDVAAVLAAVLVGEGETKRAQESAGRQWCVSLRDVGTEMTPGGSKEPSRANTPRLVLPAPAHAGAASPGRRDGGAADPAAVREGRAGATTAVSPATAWDNAKRAKYMARYMRKQLEIEDWENRERRKAELQMKMTEVQAERRNLRAQEKAARKLANAQALAKEKRARAEAELNRRGAAVRDKGALIGRRSGHSPSSLLSLKLPLMCS